MRGRGANGGVLKVRTAHKEQLEVRAVAARGKYESPTIHRLAAPNMFHYIINLLQKW